MVKKIKGTEIANKIITDLKTEVAALDITPTLAVILVGDDEASHIYVNRKQEACKKIGIQCNKYSFPDTVIQTEIIEKINELNNDQNTHAILIQLPLPAHLDTKAIINTINPSKDVDGFHPQTIDDYLHNRTSHAPGLTDGIIRLLEETNEPLRNKQAVIMSNTYVFAQPLLKALANHGIIAYWQMPSDMAPDFTKTDIAIVAVGKPGLIKAEHIKTNAILIDVGINRLPNGKVVGDIDFESIKNKAAWITPVPGGVGPMTIAMLMKNTVRLAKDA